MHNGRAGDEHILTISYILCCYAFFTNTLDAMTCWSRGEHYFILGGLLAEGDISGELTRRRLAVILVADHAGSCRSSDRAVRQR